MQTGNPLRSRVIRADFFRKVGYSTVWEDERVVELALAPRPGERVLSITSGGDLSLAFLLHDAEVLSVDFNPRQNHLLHLKKACLETLAPDDLWRALGLAPCRDRAALYRKVRCALPEEAQRYWDGREADVARGVLLCGKQDRYLHGVGRALTLVQGRRTVQGLFDCATIEEQRSFFRSRWDGPAWRVLCSILFSRRVYDLAFHKEHFRYARRDEHPAAFLRGQAERVLQGLPVRDNFYLHWLFRRTYPDRERSPAWLRQDRAVRLREKLPRLAVRTAEVETLLFELPDRSVDCFNFSNIFDWVDRDAFVALMGEVARVARPGARLCYWTNAVNTRRELDWASRVHPRIRERREEADRLFAACRTPGYSSFTLGTVR